MKIHVRPRFGKLEPVAELDEELIRKLSTEKTFQVDIKANNRSVRQLRLYWAMVKLCFDHQSLYSTTELLSDGLKMSVGFTEERMTIDGEIYYIPKSISFAKMPQDEFNIFFEAVINIVLTKIVFGVNKIEFEQRCYELIGERGPNG